MWTTLYSQDKENPVRYYFGLSALFPISFWRLTWTRVGLGPTPFHKMRVLRNIEITKLCPPNQRIDQKLNRERHRDAHSRNAQQCNLCFNVVSRGGGSQVCVCGRATRSGRKIQVGRYLLCSHQV